MDLSPGQFATIPAGVFMRLKTGLSLVALLVLASCGPEGQSPDAIAPAPEETAALAPQTPLEKILGALGGAEGPGCTVRPHRTRSHELRPLGCRAQGAGASESTHRLSRRADRWLGDRER